MVLLQIDSDQAAQIDLEVSLITTWKDVQVTPRPNVRLLSGPEGHHHRKHIFCPLKEASFQPAFLHIYPWLFGGQGNPQEGGVLGSMLAPFIPLWGSVSSSLSQGY